MINQLRNGFVLRLSLLLIVDYGVKVTRKWISELITDIGSKGFTMLAVMDSTMHPSDNSKAVINLFKTESATEYRRSIRVRRLRNQHYIKKLNMPNKSKINL
jgi:hypothetical protein